MAKKLTVKQAKFVEEYAKTGNATKSAMKAYDTEDYMTAAQIGAENLKKPQIRTLTEHLFSQDKTEQVVANLHRLAISAEDEKNQIESTKVWLDRAVPKQEVNANLNFIQINNELKDKYND